MNYSLMLNITAVTHCKDSNSGYEICHRTNLTCQVIVIIPSHHQTKTFHMVAMFLFWTMHILLRLNDVNHIQVEWSTKKEEEQWEWKQYTFFIAINNAGLGSCSCSNCHSERHLLSYKQTAHSIASHSVVFGWRISWWQCVAILRFCARRGPSKGEYKL
jgi:hypothetical protein